jgi:hypothetical protein
MKQWSETVRQDDQSTGCQSLPAQPGIAADRFAREIVRFLEGGLAARSRQLNANPLGPSTLMLVEIVW